MGTDNYLKTTTSTYYVLCRYKKPIPPRQVHVPPAAVTLAKSGDTEKIIHSQETMGDHFQKSHDIADRKQEIMREISHHQQPNLYWITITTGGTHHDPKHEICNNHQHN